jgi:hypothetical protein
VWNWHRAGVRDGYAKSISIDIHPVLLWCQKEQERLGAS